MLHAIAASGMGERDGRLSLRESRAQVLSRHLFQRNQQRPDRSEWTEQIPQKWRIYCCDF